MTSITCGRGAALSGAALLAGCLLLTACSTGTSESSASAGARAIHGAAAPAAQPVNGIAQAGQPANGRAATQTARLAPVNQSIIYTASLTLRSANAVTAAKRAIAIVTAAGGYTSAENAVARSGKSGGTVSLTLKVPVPVYQQVLTELSAPSLGKQTSLTQQATDVTQQVADVNSLVSSEQAAITALQGLLRHAADVSQLLQVQQQISTDESDLEALQAQQRALNHETSYATVNMTLVSIVHRTAPRTRQAGGGFVSGLGAGWRALRHATSWVLTALGAALPFLIIAVILAGLGYAGRRRIVRRRAGPTAAG
jgi:Domain of unknown function (DUF4349)